MPWEGLYFVLLDLSAAFDTVDHHLLQTRCWNLSLSCMGQSRIRLEFDLNHLYQAKLRARKKFQPQGHLILLNSTVARQKDHKSDLALLVIPTRYDDLEEEKIQNIAWVNLSLPDDKDREETASGTCQNKILIWRFWQIHQSQDL